MALGPEGGLATNQAGPEVIHSSREVDYSTSPELDMSSGPSRWDRESPLGSSAMRQIRLQRVRGLDRVIRGRQDVRSASISLNTEYTQRPRLLDLA